jgi:beta-1,4-N-acetylglucosaminyltransferase
MLRQVGPRRAKQHSRAQTPCRTLVVLGSGGHTAEMTALLARMDHACFQPLHFIVADTDSTSMERVKSCGLATAQSRAGATHFHTIPRSREVGQSWVSTVFTTARSFISCTAIVIRVRPELVICNGPGTCVPVCYAAWLQRFCCLGNAHIVFVESFCRVKTLSLTGKLLYPVVDRFVVQWKGLVDKFPKAEYIGQVY